MKNLYQKIYNIKIKNKKGKIKSIKFIGNLHYEQLPINPEIINLSRWENAVEFCNKNFPNADIFEDIYSLRAYPKFIIIRDCYNIYKIKEKDFCSFFYSIEYKNIPNEYSLTYLMNNLRAEEFIEYVKDTYEKLNKKKYLREDK